MKDRREKGLCYNCDEKFSPCHCCKTQTLFLLQSLEQEDESDDVNDEEKEAVEEISLHFIVGGGQTMKVQACIHTCMVWALINSGSTHNFLEPGNHSASGSS